MSPTGSALHTTPEPELHEASPVFSAAWRTPGWASSPIWTSVPCCHDTTLGYLEVRIVLVSNLEAMFLPMTLQCLNAQTTSSPPETNDAPANSPPLGGLRVPREPSTMYQTLYSLLFEPPYAFSNFELQPGRIGYALPSSLRDTRLNTWHTTSS